MAESRQFDTQSPGCLEGLLNFLALNQRMQMLKLIAYRKQGLKVPKTKRCAPSANEEGCCAEKDKTNLKETNNNSATTSLHMFPLRTLMFKKNMSSKEQKKSSSPVNSPSSLRLLRTRSIHHSKCFNYVVTDESTSNDSRMNDSSSNKPDSYHSAPPLLHENPQGPLFQEPCKSCSGVGGKNSMDLDAFQDNLPRKQMLQTNMLTDDNGVSSKQKCRDTETHHSKEFLDFLELFNAHRELFLKILHDPSLLVPTEQQEQEASSSDSVPLNKLESFPRSGGSSGKQKPLFDRSDSEQSRKCEIQRSPSRPKADPDAAKVISTRMPSGVEDSMVALAKSRSQKEARTNTNHFKAIHKKIKDIVMQNRKELARITNDGVFHKLPYGQKMAEYIKSPSEKKFVQEEKQMQRSCSIEESLDKYSTLYDSISRDSKICPERPTFTIEDGAGLKDKQLPMYLKRITSLPEMRLYSPHRDVRTEVSDSPLVSKAYNIESVRFSSRRTDSFSAFTEGSLYPDDITERTADAYSEINYGEAAFLCSSEEEFRSILQSPSLPSFDRSFLCGRICSLPSFDRSFFHDRISSFTEHSIADSEPTFEHMHLEDGEWLVKPPNLWGANLKDGEWLVKSPQPSGANAVDLEDDEWLVKPLQPSSANTVHLEDEGWLAKAPQPLGANAINSEFRFINEFTGQDEAEPLHIHINDKNEADFHYVRDILRKSGFSHGEALGEWYATNQPVSPVIFEEAECSCQELNMVAQEPDSTLKHMLLFDLINEVLLDIYDSSLVIGPWHSRFDSRTKPTPMGALVLGEVWGNVSRYLSLQRKTGQAVEDIVAHDVTRKDSWMNLVCDADYVALDLEDVMLDDLLDDVVFQIALLSIEA